MAERLIGVDVGGTKVSVALLEDGRLSEPVLHPTDQRGSSGEANSSTTSSNEPTLSAFS